VIPIGADTPMFFWMIGFIGFFACSKRYDGHFVAPCST
jgi:hypothetical protein